SGVVMSFMFFFPDVVVTDALPLTGGLAAVCLFGVLLIKLVGDPDHNARSFQLVTLLLGLGAIFYFVPYVLGVQASQVSMGGIANVGSFLVTNTNPVWAVGMAYLSIALIAVQGAFAVGYALRSGGRAEIEAPTSGQSN
ncbi:MAG TPA: hypothetical protein VF116_16990, partial [Ktedonobacterales bacterium]